MKKRILSIIIAIVMVVGLIPGGALTAFAAETDCSLANPHQIQLPYTSETLNLTHGDGWDHYYNWTAPEAGTLTVVMPEGLYCDIHIDGYVVDSGINTTLTVDVAAGEAVWFNVYTLDDVNGTWSASFAAGETTTPEGGDSGEISIPEGAVEITDQTQIQQLLEAIRADCEAGNLAQHDYLHPDEEYVAGMDINWIWIASDGNNRITRGQYVAVYECSENLKGLLKTLDIIS